MSLSREYARFLRTIRAHTQSPFMSASFEKIFADLQGKTEMLRAGLIRLLVSLCQQGVRITHHSRP
jgi:hypothetical protein